jgi:hypothetical protein
MQKKIIIILFSFLILFSIKTMAQKTTEKFSPGFGLEVGTLTGDLKNFYTLTGGLTIRGSYKVGPGFVTLTTGVIAYLPKSGVGLPAKLAIQIPVRAGYKYIFPSHFFVMGELGYASFKSYYKESGEVLSSSSGSFIGAPSVGVQLGAFEIGLRYGINFTHNDGSDISVRLGFDF